MSLFLHGGWVVNFLTPSHFSYVILGGWWVGVKGNLINVTKYLFLMTFILFWCKNANLNVYPRGQPPSKYSQFQISLKLLFSKMSEIQKSLKYARGGSSLIGNFSKNFPFFPISMNIWAWGYEYQHITNFWAKHPLMGGTTKKNEKTLDNVRHYST